MIANGLRSARLRAHMTQVEVAERLGIKQSSVSQWEQGRFQPKVRLLPALADLYNCTIDELFEEGRENP